jgi:hypothetical protein
VFEGMDLTKLPLEKGEQVLVTVEGRRKNFYNEAVLTNRRIFYFYTISGIPLTSIGKREGAIEIDLSDVDFAEYRREGPIVGLIPKILIHFAPNSKADEKTRTEFKLPTHLNGLLNFIRPEKNELTIICNSKLLSFLKNKDAPIFVEKTMEQIRRIRAKPA